jgi:hypothetical protein
MLSRNTIRSGEEFWEFYKDDFYYSINICGFGEEYIKNSFNRAYEHEFLCRRSPYYDEECKVANIEKAKRLWNAE